MALKTEPFFLRKYLYYYLIHIFITIIILLLQSRNFNPLDTLGLENFKFVIVFSKMFIFLSTMLICFTETVDFFLNKR